MNVKEIVRSVEGDNFPEEWFARMPEDVRQGLEKYPDLKESKEAADAWGKFYDWKQYMYNMPVTVLDKMEYFTSGDYYPTCFERYASEELLAKLNAVEDVREGEGTTEWEALKAEVQDWVYDKVDAVEPGSVSELEFVERYLRKDVPDWLFNYIPADVRNSKALLDKWAEENSTELEKQALPDMNRVIRFSLRGKNVNVPAVKDALEKEGFSGEVLYRALPLRIMQDGGDLPIEGLTAYCMALHDLYGSTVLRYDKK